MAPSTAYESRDPTSTLSCRIVRDHFEILRAHAAALGDGEGLPRFLDQELRDFLWCGCLAGGFARFRCTACGLDRLVAFSCNGREFCRDAAAAGWPSARRISSISVFPNVPVRCGLSLPHRRRYLLAWDSELCRAVIGVALRGYSGSCGVRARRDGLRDGRSGGVVIVQWFGGALESQRPSPRARLRRRGCQGRRGVHFHPVRRLTRVDVAAIVSLVARRVERLLERRGLTGGAESSGAQDRWSANAPILAAAAAASVEGRGVRPAGRRARPPVRRRAGGRCAALTIITADPGA